MEAALWFNSIYGAYLGQNSDKYWGNTQWKKRKQHIDPVWSKSSINWKLWKLEYARLWTTKNNLWCYLVLNCSRLDQCGKESCYHLCIHVDNLFTMSEPKLRVTCWVMNDVSWIFICIPWGCFSVKLYTRWTGIF